MKQYKLVNNLMGWLSFVIAAVVYCLTIEPTASFWDCGEFITSSYKLEVGHPPGAPFFMLTANFFTQFVKDPAMVARMVNTMSALMSAACIMFLFWTITHLTRKLILKEDEKPRLSQLITIMGSGLVGALVYTFSDTFWFSAVEGEVYAYSSLFTAVVFWLILKWEEVADEPHSDRWLVLIAYLTGLSIGVHLLNLLCIPAIVLVYYYKKNPNANAKGSLLALLGSMVLVGLVLYGIVPGFVKVGGWFELLFVNNFGLPFNSGVIFYIIVLASAIFWGVYESYVEKNPTRMKLSFLATVALLGIPFYGYGSSSILIGVIVLGALSFYLFSKAIKQKYQISARTLNTSLLCIMMIMVGYSSYALIVIRSTANTPMDQNSPEDIFTLGSYLGREQYGTRPLFYGQAYSSKVKLETKDGYCSPVIEEGAPVYSRKDKNSPNEKDQYIITGRQQDYVYAQKMLFPRMYSSAHESMYKNWEKIEGYDVPYDQCGEMVMVNMPTQWENIKFFFSYQMNFMYWRYFMWNFAGRQNDIQGSGEIEHGNWITGIKFIDNALVGDQSKLPDELANNKGHNIYYCLPLLLGIIGILFQAYRGQKGIQGFWVVFFLFFMTGIAIVIYLNQTPSQPRERDYAYAGSFYAFAIWIGMGVAGLIKMLSKKLGELPSAIIASVACLLVPIQMAGQTWDDHDRSGRYACRDIGQNYLMSCQEKNNPIIFTNGDNDTFPLWYNQETEGFRTDVRVCNLSYLQTDWYIDQMKRPAYNSPSVPITWTRPEYVSGANEYIQIRPEVKETILSLYKSNPVEAKKNFGENPFELKNILKYWVRSDKEDLKIIPTDSIVIKLDKEAIKRSGMMIPDSLNGEIPDYMTLSLKGKRGISKSELMMLEMIDKCNWSRPVYMAISVGSENHLCFANNFCQEGLVYRITPFNTTKLGARIDSEKMYDNIMHKFKWGGMDNPKVYLDENHMRMCYSHRRLFAQTATQLLKEGKKDKALKMLDYAAKVIPTNCVPHDYQSGSLDMAEAYIDLGQKDKAEKILKDLAAKSYQYVNWYLSFNDRLLATSNQDCLYHLYILDEINKALKAKQSPLLQEYSRRFETLYSAYSMRTGGAR
ncbi:protein O-mannosyl-transferase family [Bacteroides sedimenti]|uniref:Membrane protein n=1 Tax=Bacteroides sedimenti TaxID=2136147 RepID=A0ABM8IDG8_9BACE